MSAPHPVGVGRVGDFLPQLHERLKPSQVFVLVDENTRQHCLPYFIDQVPAFAKTPVITIPAGETTKTIATSAQVWDVLVEARADRNAVLINLGGGVVTDLGGYAAGCYKRGIRFVHVSTTVLGQVDASLGGKTGVDFGGIKNSVGLFRMPEAVVADPHFFTTLPPREVRSGMAEMYKHALIADATHWRALQDTGGDLLADPAVAELIAYSQRIKLNVVEADPLEHGIREALNFGHSIGHAMESILLESEAPALHGEAIAAGMVCEAFLSQQLTGLHADAVTDIVQTLLGVYGKLSFEESDLARLLALIANDKKNQGGVTRMSLLSKIGVPTLGIQVPNRAIEAAIHRYIAL